MGVCAHGGIEVCKRECLCRKEVEAEIGKEPDPASTLWSMTDRPDMA